MIVAAADAALARARFFGVGRVVLDQLASSAGSIDLRSVIDGQQRLTTLLLFLVRAILDVLLESASPRAPQLRRLIENPSDVIRSEVDRYKLWPRRRDRTIWQAAMADDGLQSALQPDHLYLEGAEVLCQQCSGFDDAGKRP